MSAPQLGPLFEQVPHFSGTTYEPSKDHKRLAKQFIAVRDYMLGHGEWRTLAQLSAALGYPEASVSARLRDLRRERFGGFTVERMRVGTATFRYRVRKAEGTP
jgi:hypothetical protein